MNRKRASSLIAAAIAGALWAGLGRGDGGGSTTKADLERARVLVLLDLARANESDLQAEAGAYCAFVEEKRDPSDGALKELSKVEKRFVSGSSCSVDPDSGVRSADGKIGLVLRVREIHVEGGQSMRVVGSYFEHGHNAGDYEFRLRRGEQGWRIASRRRLSVA